MIEFKNLNKQELIEEIIKRGDGNLNEYGSIKIETDSNISLEHFIVFDEKSKSIINWNCNNKISENEYFLFKEKVNGYLLDKEVFAQTVNIGSYFKLPINIITTNPYYTLFAKTIYEDLNIELSQYNLYFLPNLNKDNPKIIYNLYDFNIYICGTDSSEEIIRSSNYLLNNILPDLNVLPIKCMVNCNENNDQSTLFIGTSELEKYIILNNTSRYIVGGENHQWSDSGLHGIDFGINLDKSYYEQSYIYKHINKFGSIIENDFDAIISLDNISNYVKNGTIINPTDVVFFLEDTSIPYVSKVTKEQAFLLFIIINNCEIYPQNLAKYASLFYNKLKRLQPNIWLINSYQISDDIENKLEQITNKTIIAEYCSSSIFNSYRSILDNIGNIDDIEALINTIPVN